jgi:hypothetical protein
VMRLIFRHLQARQYLADQAGDIHLNPLTKLLVEIRQIASGLYNQA